MGKRGRKRVLPENAVQYTVHLSPDDSALLDRIRTAAGQSARTTKAEVLRDATAVGLRLLAKELNVT